jgi:hypothetical protein
MQHLSQISEFKKLPRQKKKPYVFPIVMKTTCISKGSKAE